MPKRTNEFQEVVDSIQRLFAPKNAEITTSAMVAPLHGGTPREVDILVKFKTELGIPFTLAVEAKDHSRPIDSMGVENYIGKYNNTGGIRVDKVLIVAHSFTSTAKTRANDLGFSLHTLNELNEQIVGQFERDNQDDSGAWWLNKNAKKEEGHKRVEVDLFAFDGSKLPLNTTVVAPRKTKKNLGTAREWADRILEFTAAPFANEQFREWAGVMINPILEAKFSDHKGWIGKKSVKLDKMTFDFGMRMQFPKMQSKEFELEADDGETKRIVQEIGENKGTKLKVTYEHKKGSDSAEAIRVDHVNADGSPPESKRIIKKIKF
ncbi:hypothetical protein DDZ13_14965 [Coraliomargarita sinensis]|uniref:Restriction endonuclease type IV Mrr domain-containing protein n=1 Tax=Coraliomargarita sinensis TaxID=2174842 RepID=A0A317ZFA5_9BACT|nr:hypothetical protein [Coraliomargarita sinensis]PXA02853.1 hypothetical protein DDZ13_14965 [Coraliomargarita sinensis]